MSRTKRNYGHDINNRSKTLEKTWLGIGDYWSHHDPRNAFENGFDGVSPSYYHERYPTKGWTDNYQGDTRKFLKRSYWKQHRRYHTRELMRELIDNEAS